MNYDNTKPSTQTNPPKDDQKPQPQDEQNKNGQHNSQGGDDKGKDSSNPGGTQPEQKKM